MPAITFGGVGSGIDTEAIISGLLGASRSPINRVQQRLTNVNSATSTVSSIGTALSKLKDALVALDTNQEVGSFRASSSNSDAVVATASGGAQPGSFEVDVISLAKAYKAYSEPLGVATTSEATGQDGVLRIEVGGETAEVTVQGTDSLDTIVENINAAGIKIAASALVTEDGVRLQVRGLEAGAANNVNITQLGTDFGFEVGDNTKSVGQDAVLEIDGFRVTSPTNQVSGAISGVTLALTEENTGPITIDIERDEEALVEKLQTFVSAYNDVVNQVHKATGFGSIKATNSELSADSSLRAITGRLGSALLNPAGSGRFQTLGSIGVELNNDGTLTLDEAELRDALFEDSRAVSRVLAGEEDFSGSFEGVIDNLRTAAEGLLDTGGVIDNRKEALRQQSDDLGDRLLVEEARLDRLEDQLRRQFTQMDQVVSFNQSQLDFLIQNA